MLLTALLPFALAATLDVPAGAPLADALARAAPGDVVRLGPGLHAGSLGRLSGLRIEGAGAGSTRVAAPEGQDGAVVTGRVELEGLTIEAGDVRSALKVLGGEAHVRDVDLRGVAVGAFVDGGRLDGSGVTLAGATGLLVRDGEVVLRGGRVRPLGAARAGVALLHGMVDLSRFSLTGPFGEAAITVGKGAARLDDVVIRAPGPAGIAVTRGEVIGRSVEIAGARELPAGGTRGADGVLGDCVQVLRGTLRLEASGLTRCGGAALSASGGSVRLDGVDVQGGSAGGLALLDGVQADLRGNWITGRGPGLVAASGAQADATFNRWRTDPVFWVDCGAGARVRLGFGEHAAEPCTKAK
ncbi:MAG TPA: hypothetical protein VLT47_11710 [Anaeromyxobacteraceae bacterium]|nr:hypothetical protein [Anaeromyxobacteraceae bacterium]